MSDTSSNLVPAVDRAIQILFTFHQGDESYGVSDLSRMLDLNKSTVFDILNTLTHHNLLEREEETKKYRLGPALFHLGNLVGARLTLRAIVQPFLVEVLKEFGSTTILARLASNGRVLIVDSAEPEVPLKLSVTPGTRLESGESVFARLFRAATSDGDAETLAVRSRGYVTDDQESVAGVRAVGVPLNDREGRVIATLTVMDFVRRMDETKIARLIDALPHVGQRISERLGARSYPQWNGIWTD
ncbi:MAG: IclR family transcriptional regulator [Ardenticatenales bacterium]|nr:IclR family transcriptional regulator [Ardenticatenales bacterium]